LRIEPDSPKGTAKNEQRVDRGNRMNGRFAVLPAAFSVEWACFVLFRWIAA